MMKRRIHILVACLFFAVCAFAVGAEEYTLLSPDKSVAVTVTADGGITYSVTKDGKAVLDNGSVGLVTKKATYPGTLSLTGVSEHAIDETVPMTSGSYKTIENKANELTLTFGSYSVIFRAYNDGAAFRQAVDGSGRVEVSADASTVTLPAQANTWAMKTENTNNAYSTAYTNAVAESMSGMYNFPVMYQTTDGVWCLLTEANLFASDFAGCVLSMGENNSFSLTFAAYQNGADVWIDAPGTTPWRTVICGELATMVENTMVDALTPKADGDYSYVETGVSAWSWLNDGSPRQDDVALLKRYIDLAHEMRWEYFILDEGWQPHAAGYTYDNRVYSGFPAWLPEIMKYAEERDVKLIAWLNRRAVDTASEVDFLEEIKAAGFAGIKVDFFDSESSAIVVYYNRILEKCRELGLLVNIHGTNKPTGERMTYPNIIAKEAVRGDEAMNTKAAYTTLMPFTRGSLGSTDFTPAVYPFSKSDTTVGHQAALATLIECGMLTMASAPDAYYASPLYWYYYDLPTHWDDLHFIDGYPGEYIAVARKSGEAWYVSAVTTDARTLTVPTDFLAEGAYNVAIYGDGGDGSNGAAAYTEIARGETITIPLIQNGGAVVKFVPKDDLPQGIAFAKDTVLLSVGEEQTAPLKMPETAFPDVLWTSSDDSIVTVKNGHIIGMQSGNATITATSAADASITATLHVHVFGGHTRADGWTVKNEAENFSERAVMDNADPYRMTVTTTVGYVGVKEEAEPSNLWIIDAPKGDFAVTVKVTGAMTHSYNSCLVGVYADGESVIQMSRRFHASLGEKAGAPASKLGTVGNIFDFYTYTTKYVEKYTADTKFAAPAWLRITREGDIFRGYYSYDGENFTEMPGTLSNDGVTSAESLQLVLACQMGGNSTFNNAVVFEDFTLNGERIPFAVANEVTPEEITVKDVLLGLQGLLKGRMLPAVDMDRSGTLTLLDILQLLKLLIK